MTHFFKISNEIRKDNFTVSTIKMAGISGAAEALFIFLGLPLGTNYLNLASQY